MSAKFNAERLKALRKEKHITQESLAARANLTDRYLRDLESGRKDNPSASLVCRISTALEIPMDELMKST